MTRIGHIRQEAGNASNSTLRKVIIFF